LIAPPSHRRPDTVSGPGRSASRAPRAPAPSVRPDVIQSGPRGRVLNLFKEAWRRRRRRRAAAAVATAAVLAAAATAAWAGGWPGTGAPGRARGASHAPGGWLGALGRAGAPLVAWVDDNGGLHVGDLATGRQRRVATISADNTVPLVSAGGRLYWVDSRGGYLRGYGQWPDVVRSLDLATGRIRGIAPGQAVFASADGRHVFIAWTGTDVIEVPADGPGRARQLAVPRGWLVAGNGGIAGGGPGDLGVAGDGILVQASEYQTSPEPTMLGWWDPRTGAVRVLGRMANGDNGLVGATTLPGGQAGLVATFPASCGRVPGFRCVRITDTATLSSVTVRSPSRYGFGIGGAFSADGRWLAAFVITDVGGQAGPAARLAIVDTRTGRLRLVPGARYRIGAATLWAGAIGGHEEFVAGGPASAYLVNAVTLAERPVHFLPGDRRSLDISRDINYSAVVLRPPE
jgi:hypothetical protein